MIDWQFEDEPPCINQVQTILIPNTKDPKCEDDWIYKNFDIIMRVVCSDGTFLVVMRKEF